MNGEASRCIQRKQAKVVMTKRVGRGSLPSHTHPATIDDFHKQMHLTCGSGFAGCDQLAAYVDRERCAHGSRGWGSQCERQPTRRRTSRGPTWESMGYRDAPHRVQFGPAVQVLVDHPGSVEGGVLTEGGQRHVRQIGGYDASRQQAVIGWGEETPVGRIDGDQHLPVTVAWLVGNL